MHLQAVRSPRYLEPRSLEDLVFSKSSMEKYLSFCYKSTPFISTINPLNKDLIVITALIENRSRTIIETKSNVISFWFASRKKESQEISIYKNPLEVSLWNLQEKNGQTHQIKRTPWDIRCSCLDFKAHKLILGRGFCSHFYCLQRWAKNNHHQILNELKYLDERKN